MLDTIKALVSDLTQFVHIIVGLLKGGAGVLSTEGSLAGSSAARDTAGSVAGSTVGSLWGQDLVNKIPSTNSQAYSSAEELGILDDILGAL